ncbi:MAG: M24 family metallopeptidase [Spirochaetes bacterium]|nr:M24 family metallopeptidase [Acidobacteriota bacterium]MCX7038758.1 M24 family metallopeptidase [Spirochaetota bacterium]
MSLPEASQGSFRERQARLAARLAREGVFACVLEDFENARNQALRWLSGHPTDAILIAFADGQTVLVPWDVNLANDRAAVDRIIPYTNFKRSFREAVIGVLKEKGLTEGGAARRIEFSARTSHLRQKELVTDLPGAEILIRSDGVESFLGKARTIKDQTEIAALEKASAITNTLIGMIEESLASPQAAELRELALAQLLEREALALGAEGMGFETLAAGASRSWAIHPFPAYSRERFGEPGLSILDFGVRVEGYTSDVTLTVARGALSAEQERMIGLVEKAYAAAMAAALPGSSPQEPARRADEVFAAAGYRMPHALGHGIGLEAHEGPLLRSQGECSDPALLPGMVFTIEPGLYDPAQGGVRWENDVLIEPDGAKVLTKARIIRLP